MMNITIILNTSEVNFNARVLHGKRNKNYKNELRSTDYRKCLSNITSPVPIN